MGRLPQSEVVRAVRWRGRTDLYFLATEILGYKSPKYAFGVTKEVHQPLIDRLQQFPLPDKATQAKFDYVTPSGCQYPYGGRPPLSHKQLPGKRQRLILDARSMFKTTINCVCHSIQWLLNYPDIAIALFQSNVTKAEEILKETKSHFLHNQTFREIYPEYCPKNPRKEFGNRTEFTIPNRTNLQRKEPSISCASIDAGMAGRHFEVMKFSDIVDPKNIRTPQGLADVKYMFEMSKKLLVDPDDYIDVEGTRYDFADLYGSVIDEQMKLAPSKRDWDFFIRGIYKRDTGGLPYTFNPEELEYPFLLEDGQDDEGKPMKKYVSWWPERFSVDYLEKSRHATADSEEVFATQMLNDPQAVTGRKVFPVDEIHWMDADEFAKVGIVYYTTRIDTAETANERSDFSAITTAGWDRSGRCYIVDIRHGRMLTDELVSNIFAVWTKYKPISIGIEETSFVRGLKPTITRRGEQLGANPLFEFIQRDTQTSKNERIMGFQPWFKSGELRFMDNLPQHIKDQLKLELGRFDPTKKANRDDILDTIADQFQLRDHFGRISARKTLAEATEDISKRYLQGLITGEMLTPDGTVSNEYGEMLDRTGGL